MGYFVVTQSGYKTRMVTIDFNLDQATDYEITFTSQSSSSLWFDDFSSIKNSIQFTSTNHVCITGIIKGSTLSDTGVAACSFTDRRLTSQPLLVASATTINMVPIIFTGPSLQITSPDTSLWLIDIGYVPLDSDTDLALKDQEAYPEMVNFVTKQPHDSFI